MSHKFIECRTCAAKPGSPTLCNPCLSNRTTIAALQGNIAELEDQLGSIINITGPEFIELIANLTRISNTITAVSNRNVTRALDGLKKEKMDEKQSSEIPLSDRWKPSQ